MPSPIDVATGLRIREVRKQRGISQTELGAAIGISFQQVQKYERGTNRVSISALYGMAAALGVAPVELLPGPPPAGAVPGGDELLRIFRDLPDTLRDVTLGFVRSMAEREEAAR